jgi:thioredoxin reductase
MWGLFSRDGIGASELREIAREQLRKYETVKTFWETVVDFAVRSDGVDVRLSGGSVLQCRAILLATGVTDLVPQIEGMDEMYGRSVYHCTTCDAYCFKGQPVGVLGAGKKGSSLALEMLLWTKDVVLFTNGSEEPFPPEHERVMRERNVSVFGQKIVRLVGTEGNMESVELDGGLKVPRKALFFNTGRSQYCDLMWDWFRTTQKEDIDTGDNCGATQNRVWCAGNRPTERTNMMVCATAEGARAAIAINAWLLKQDLGVEEL